MCIATFSVCQRDTCYRQEGGVSGKVLCAGDLVLMSKAIMGLGR